MSNKSPFLRHSFHYQFCKYSTKFLSVLFFPFSVLTPLRRRVQSGLNKGEARNALARAVFFNRLGEIRDYSFEQQQYRASGLNLLTAAIVLWNTVYIERAVKALREQGQEIDDDHLQYLSPLGWEHISMTGDYVWKSNFEMGKGKFRPFRGTKDF